MYNTTFPRYAFYTDDHRHFHVEARRDQPTRISLLCIEHYLKHNYIYSNFFPNPWKKHNIKSTLYAQATILIDNHLTTHNRENEENPQIIAIFRRILDFMPPEPILNSIETVAKKLFWPGVGYGSASEYLKQFEELLTQFKANPQFDKTIFVYDWTGNLSLEDTLANLKDRLDANNSKEYQFLSSFLNKEYDKLMKTSNPFARAQSHYLHMLFPWQITTRLEAFLVEEIMLGHSFYVDLLYASTKYISYHLIYPLLKKGFEHIIVMSMLNGCSFLIPELYNTTNSHLIPTLINCCQQATRLGSKDHSPLSAAMAYGDIGLAKRLIAERRGLVIFMDSKGRVPLFYAETKEFVNLLLDNSTPIDHQDHHGVTAFMEAIEKRRDDLIDIFIEKNANPNLISSDGTTCLGIALRLNLFAICIKLISYGADWTLRLVSGAVLDLFICNATPEELEKLLKLGFNPNEQYSGVFSPLHRAITFIDDQRKVKALIEAGADRELIKELPFAFSNPKLVSLCRDKIKLA